MAKNSIILNVDDLPSADQMLHASSRLMKDYKLLKRMRGSKDIEDPDSLKNVASWLEMLIKREKALKKNPKQNSEGFDISINTIVLYLLEMEDWELHQTIEETDLKKLMKRLKGKQDD